MRKLLKQHITTVKDDEKTIIYLGLYGSQNYKLDTKDSDVDSKAISLPTIREVALNLPKNNHTIVLENNEHIDVKDIRLMFECFYKQNINFLEILFCDEYWVDPLYKNDIQKLRNMREDIARYDQQRGINAAVGMSLQKLNALEHPYPTIEWKINKWGYDGKQLSHILRLENFIDSFYVHEYSFKESLTRFHLNNKELLIETKQNKISLEAARKLANDSVKRIQTMKESLLKNNYQKNNSTEFKMKELLYEIFKKSFILELREKGEL